MATKVPKSTRSAGRSKKDQTISEAFIKADGNTTKAAEIAGMSRKGMHKALKRESVKEAISDILDRLGATDEILLKKNILLLEAKRVISANIVQVKSDDPEVKDVEAHVNTKDFIEVDDNFAQLKALELLYKVKGTLKPENKGDSNVGNTYNLTNIQIEGKSTDDLIRELNTKLSSQYRR